MACRLCSRVGPIVAALGFFVLCVPSTAQVQLSKSTKAAHDVFLEGYARTNNKCESIDPPSSRILESVAVKLDALVRVGICKCPTPTLQVISAAP
jgi:hypothetical protein